MKFLKQLKKTLTRKGPKNNTGNDDITHNENTEPLFMKPKGILKKHPTYALREDVSNDLDEVNHNVKQMTPDTHNVIEMTPVTDDMWAPHHVERSEKEHEKGNNYPSYPRGILKKYSKYDNNYGDNYKEEYEAP